MLTKDCFKKCFDALLSFKGIPVEDKRDEMFYALIKKDFNDIEFSDICGDICRNEELFNKYPDPVLFYKRKMTNDDKATLSCDDFLLKVDIYLSRNFLCDSEKAEFSENLTETERGVLARHGGISTLWQDCHREGYSRSIDNVLKDLKDDFMDMSRLERKVDYVMIEQQGNPEIADKLKNMISSSLKKIGG